MILLYIEKKKTIKKRLEQRETYFDRLHEIYLRIEILIDCEETFKQLFEEFNKLTNGYFSECKDQRVVVGNKINELLDLMKENEKNIKENQNIERSEKILLKDYDEYKVDVEKYTK